MDVEYVKDALYAVEHSHEWHLALWDGECFDVISNWQHGDRWVPEWLTRIVLVTTDPFTEQTHE